MSARDVLEGALRKFAWDIDDGWDVKECTNHVLSALAAAGYKVLSREPTEEMSVGDLTTQARLRHARAIHGTPDWDDIWRTYWDAASPPTDPEKQT